MSKSFVIFDRDGTLIELVPYLKEIDQVIFKPDLIEALQLLNRQSFNFGIITNQSGISRGFFDDRQVAKINEFIKNYLQPFQIKFEFIYFCPHTPENNCECRKPNTALGELAVKNFDIDINRSFMVGDQESDIKFGSRLGLKTVQICENLVNSTYPHFHSDTLMGAAKWIISQ